MRQYTNMRVTNVLMFHLRKIDGLLPGSQEQRSRTGSNAWG